MSFLSILNKPAEVCKECGCRCSACKNDHSLDLQHEIETLTAKVRASQLRVAQMERELSDSREAADIELSQTRDELIRYKDKYDRLYDNYKKLQRINHNLEDTSLKVVSKSNTEKMDFREEIESLKSKLVEARVMIADLEEENEKISKDCFLAVQLLQAKPSNFVAHKLNTLPMELQERVRSHLPRNAILHIEPKDGSGVDDSSEKHIRVPMPTFPPTAMVYSVNKVPKPVSQEEYRSNVPTPLIAQVLSENMHKWNKRPRRVMVCCKCTNNVTFHDKSVQTPSNGRTTSIPFSSTPGVHRPRTSSTETEI
ncbi:DgyrCDS2985 [Dimorphilus gyrociliatus]|uniref:DgyrCDS2985 n=1 Tax=Dimorphilus gyrociliatus TaxID=2664684 RepID=A0A7I8VDR3_9ANNE|nr:DgyrCDS2985 [Dimorphilus gyrociliatus]